MFETVVLNRFARAKSEEDNDNEATGESTVRAVLAEAPSSSCCCSTAARFLPRPPPPPFFFLSRLLTFDGGKGYVVDSRRQRGESNEEM